MVQGSVGEDRVVRRGDGLREHRLVLVGRLSNGGCPEVDHGRGVLVVENGVVTVIHGTRLVVRLIVN